MKSKIMLFAIAGGVLLVCSACNKEASLNTNLKSDGKNIDSEEMVNVPYLIPDSYTKEVENITFNTEVIVNPKVLDEGLYYTTATLKEIDYDKVYEVLFKEKEAVEKEEYDVDEGKYVSYQNKDENLELTPACFIYSMDAVDYYDNSFSVADDDYNANFYSTDLEFDFATKEETLSKIKNTLDQIGLNIEGNYNCYSLDYQTLQKEEYAVGKDGKEDSSVYKPNWSEEDNGYYFIAHQTLQNCIVQYPIVDVFEKVSEENAPIKILNTKNGILFLEIENLFDFQVSKDYITLLSFEEIANKLSEKYQMLLTESNYEVTKAELYMRPMINAQEEYDVIPTWQFTIIDSATDSESQTYINAITGEEIV